MGHKHKHSHALDFYTAARFTSDDLGKLFLFRDRCTGTLYTFELLDCVTKSVAELDALLIDEYNLRPDVAVEQIWCRVTPSDFDRERLIIGFDESYSDIYTEEADGPVAFGLQLKPAKKLDGEVFTASTLKPDADSSVSWKIEVWNV